MKKIGITGGKGGVGKSTVAVLLANKLRSQNKKVVLCDADVECPNDYLLLGEKLKKPIQKVFAKFPKLDKSKCIKCGLCVKNCRSNAIFKAPNQYPLFLHELCSGCGLCWHLCSQKAIEVEKKVIGEIFENPTGLKLVTGRSVEVTEETGPIVTETRKYAEKLAQKSKTDYLLIDTAVGMHCGVIRALINVDLAYAVTEPTPLGAHDLKLILELLKKLKVPAQIVLNQADLGNRRSIDQIAQHFGVKIAYEIPYSKAIVKAYSKGKLGELNLLKKIMPIYTFHCPKCGHKFTDMFPMSQSGGKNIVCPKCKSKGAKRVYEGSFLIGKKTGSACSTGVCPLNGK